MEVQFKGNDLISIILREVQKHLKKMFSIEIQRTSFDFLCTISSFLQDNNNSELTYCLYEKKRSRENWFLICKKIFDHTYLFDRLSAAGKISFILSRAIYPALLSSKVYSIPFLDCGGSKIIFSLSLTHLVCSNKHNQALPIALTVRVSPPGLVHT